MKVTLEPTTKIVTLQTPSGEVPARIWEGTTESGMPVHAYITRIAIDKDAPQEVHEQFQTELQEQKAPSAAIQSIPLKLIL